MANTIDSSNYGNNPFPADLSTPDHQNAWQFQAALSNADSSGNAPADAPNDPNDPSDPNDLANQGYSGGSTPDNWMYSAQYPLTPQQCLYDQAQVWSGQEQNVAGNVADQTGTGMNDGMAMAQDHKPQGVKDGPSVGLHAVEDVQRSVDSAENWVGGKIGQIASWFGHKTDETRDWLNDHGGVLGKAASDVLGVGEGVVGAVYGTVQGTVQMALGAADLVNPLEWAANPEGNEQRLEALKNGVEGVAQIADLANPIAWASNPEGNFQFAKTLTEGIADSASTAWHDDPSKFIGNLIGTAATFAVPGGGEAKAGEEIAEIGSAAEKFEDVAEGAGNVAKVGEEAGAAGDAAKVGDVATDAAKLEEEGGDVAGGLDKAENAADTAAEEEPGDYGVAFFGESSLKFYTPEHATLGAPGQSFFMMPIEDASNVTDAASAARYTGMSPSTLQASIEHGDIYGISFPTKGMDVKGPTAADAGGWPHFLEGGQTAVRLEGPKAGYMANPVHEFVVPGGSAVPHGSVLFKLEPTGSWTPIRKF